MAQCLNVYTAPAEGMITISSTHIGWLTVASNFSIWEIHASGPHRHLAEATTHTDTENEILKIIKFNIFRM